MLKTTLTLSALYLAAVGLGLTFFPLAFGVGAVPPDASPELVSLLRLLGGPFLGIAALNWQARKGGPSALGNILLANLIGFGVVRSEEHTSELQSLMRISYAVFCLKKKQ